MNPCKTGKISTVDNHLSIPICCHLGVDVEIGRPSGLIDPKLLRHRPFWDCDLCSPSCLLGRRVRWAHNLRNGFGVPLPELDGESSYYHLPITRCPKETDYRQVYPDAHGLVGSLSPLPCMRSRSTRENLTRFQVSCRTVLSDNFCERTLQFTLFGDK